MTPELNIFHRGDALTVLGSWPDSFVQCCVTSPPYWGLRDYGVAGQLGLEKSPEEYVAKMVEVFREVRRVLKDDGTLWLNLGDSYWGGKGQSSQAWSTAHTDRNTLQKPQHQITGMNETRPQDGKHDTIKPKDLVGIPWMVAFALRADGWYLRSDIIWSKPNPMPESVQDRPTKAHEYIFLLSKSARYYYNAKAIAEPASEASIERWNQPNIDNQVGSTRANGGAKTNGNMKVVGGPRSDKQRGHSRRHAGFNDRWDQMERAEQCGGTRNKRSVWEIATKPFPEAHFATYPPELVETCILAGTKEGDIVLDPFGGSGTTGARAQEMGRNWLMIELNPQYIELAHRTRLVQRQLI